MAGEIIHVDPGRDAQSPENRAIGLPRRQITTSRRRSNLLIPECENTCRVGACSEIIRY